MSLRELQRTLSAIPKGSYNHVQCFGLHGTYDDGLEFLQTPSMRQKQKLILSLGSSIGNFKRNDAADFLKAFSQALNPNDSFLIAIDGCKDPNKVYTAYNDIQGVTHKFIRNGLENANKILDHTAFDLDIWRVVGQYDEAAGRHHAFVTPSVDTQIEGVLVKKDEMVRIEESYKYDEEEVKTLWMHAGLDERASWSVHDPHYGMCLCVRASFNRRVHCA